jgi:NADP-reducing hydrogenase subunit HndB
VEKRIKSPADLAALRDRVKGELDLRSAEGDVEVTVHMGTCGIAAGARDVLTQLVAELEGASAEQVVLRQASCAGLCDQEPMITLTDKAGKEFRYGKLDRRKVHEIVREHVLGGKPVIDYIVTY